MCVIFFSWRIKGYRLVLLSNRDEDLPRPSASLSEWAEAPGLIAGRDIERGGTWLGVSRAGRVAAITNVRVVFEEIRSNMLSRGELPVQFLKGDASVRSFADEILARASLYNDFNLLLSDTAAGELDVVHCDATRDRSAVHEVTAGVHGLSNADLDDPWPKVVRGKRLLAEALERISAPATDEDVDRLFAILRDRTGAPDDELPKTGCGLETERNLAPIHVVWPEFNYATRAMTVILVTEGGDFRVLEESLDPATGRWERREERFAVPMRPAHVPGR